jgi:hypothetical protein
MANYPPLSFDASYKSLPDKIFSFKANAFDIYEESVWPCTGVKIGAGNKVPDNLLWVIPKECASEAIVSYVVRSWHETCKHVFAKQLNIDNFISISTHLLDKAYPVIALTPEEENQEWILLWSVTRIEISKNLMRIYWAPTHKRLYQSRIIEDFDSHPDEYKIIDANVEFPLAEGPALRLESDIDHGQEEFRRRIRDARLRTKLYKYRCEKLALQFEKKYGYYPTEDEEEAQTEYETDTSSV